MTESNAVWAFDTLAGQALQLDICLAFTALHALEKGYEVYFVVDASAATTRETHDTAVMRLVQAGATPMNWLAVASELLQGWVDQPLAPAIGEIIFEHLPTWGHRPNSWRPAVNVSERSWKVNMSAGGWRENRIEGLSAFPLTPMDEDRVNEAEFAGLVERLSRSDVDSITVLGSTGMYPYLTRSERRRVARVAVQHAGDVPVLIGIGALRTRDVLDLAEDAQAAQAAGVLLAPVSYHALSPDEVFGLYDQVTRALSVPLIVYDNPATTHFNFTDGLYQSVGRLSGVASIKIPGARLQPGDPVGHVNHLRSLLPDHVSIGVSGDSSGATGLNAGCDAWYSVIAGTLPRPAAAIARAARAGDADLAASLSDNLRPLWDMFEQHGSLRVMAAIAYQLGLISAPGLPLPLRGLGDVEQAKLALMIDRMDLGN